MSSKIAPKPIVYIYPRAYHLMSLWSKLGGDKGQEFTCLGRAQLGSTGDVFVTDAWLVKHEGNAGAVEADDDDINELIFDLYEKGIEPQELRVWVHSHPGTGQSATYLSGTDESNISRFMTGEWLISIVFDSAGENPYTRIDFKNPRAKIVADLEVHYFLSTEDTKWATELFEEKATKKTGVSYPSQHRGSGSTPAYQSWGSGYQGSRGSHGGGNGDGKGKGKGGSSSSAQAGGSWHRNQSKSQKKAEKKAERKAQNRVNRETAALAIAAAPPQAGQKGSTSGSNTAAKAEKKEGDQSHRSSIVPYAWAKSDAPADMGSDYYTGLDEDYADWDWNVDGGKTVGPHSMTKREVHELALNCVVYLDSIGMRVLENDITIEEGIVEIQELGFTEGDAEDQLDQRTGGSGTTRAEQKVNDAEIEEMEMGPVERMEAHLRDGISGARAVPAYESLAYEGDDDYPADSIPWYRSGGFAGYDDKEDDIDAAETRELFLKSETDRTVEEGTQEVIGFEYPITRKDEGADDAVAEAWEQMNSAKREEALERWEEETTEFFKEAEASKDAREEAEFEADLKAEEEAAARLDELVMTVLEEMEDELNAWEVEHERANPYFDHAAINQLAWDSVSKEWDPVYVSFWRSRGHEDAKSNVLVKAWKGLTDLFDGRSFRERNDDALRIARYWLYDDAGVEYAHGKAVGEGVVDPVDDASSDEFPEVVTPSQLAAEASQVLIDDDEKISQEAGRMWIVPRRPEEKEKEEMWDTPWGTAQRIASHTDRFAADVHKQMRETPGAIDEALAGTLNAKRLADLVLEDEIAQAYREHEAEQHQDSLDAAEAVVRAVDANPDPQEAFAAGQRAYSTATDPQYVAQTIAARMDRTTDDILERMRATPGAIDEAQAGTLTALRLFDLEDDHRRRCKLFAENGPGAVPEVVKDAVPTPIPVDDTEKMLSKTEPTIEVIDLTDEVNEVADEV